MSKENRLRYPHIESKSKLLCAYRKFFSLAGIFLPAVEDCWCLAYLRVPKHDRGKDEKP